MLRDLRTLSILVSLIPFTLGFPAYRSLARLTPEQVREVAQSFASTPGAQPLPSPLNDTSSKLVYDDAHPWQAPQETDIRGPCPGLNTLANHGYLPRSGVATPAQIIDAAQEGTRMKGFNLDWGLAAFATYGIFVVDGNHLTNLMSIGANTTEDDYLIPGISIHGNFEGEFPLVTEIPLLEEGFDCDASTTRGDAYFGDNYSFNETLFDQLVDAANEVGDGYITIESASLHKARRINDSMTRNPTFNFDTFRYITAYGETIIPLGLFVSNQTVDTTINTTLDDARSFFQNGKYPDGFYRRQGTFDLNTTTTMANKVSELVGVSPGHNEGLGNYVLDANHPRTPCYGYQRQTNLTAALYPNATGDLLTAIKANLVTFYETLQDPECEQLFPFGQ